MESPPNLASSGRRAARLCIPIRSVHLLFLDESGQLAERRFFALGGVAVCATPTGTRLRDLWQETLAAHGWPLDREVKWHGIRKGEVPPALADAVVGALAPRAVRCYVTLLDIELGVRDAPELLPHRRGHLRDRPDVPRRALPTPARGSGRRRDDRRRQPLPRGRRTPAPLLRRPHQGRQPRTRSSTGSSRGCSSARATTRSASSAPTSSARSPRPPSAAAARRAAT